MDYAVQQVTVTNFLLNKCIVNTTKIYGVEVYKDSTYFGTFNVTIECNCNGVTFTVSKDAVEFTYTHKGLSKDWKDIVKNNIIDSFFYFKQ